MARLWGSVFERKASNSGAVSRAISQSPSRWGFYQPNAQWDIDHAVTHGYEKVMMVFRCVDAIASKQARLPMVHRKGDPKDGKLVNNPQINTLLNIRSNMYETSQAFRYRLSSQLLLSRRGAFIELVGNPENPDSIHLLPAGQVEPIPDPVKFVSGYRVRDSDLGEQILKPEQVIWIKLKPHPTDPYQQMTPLAAAGLAVETDWLARMFNRNFLINDGRPGLLITVRGQVNDEDAQEIKRRFSGGYQTAGQATVIEADGLDVADLGATPRDAQWQEMIAGSAEDIRISFGTPESVLGNASGRTYDNADAELEMFWQHTMLDHCDPIAAGFDVFTGKNNDDEVIAFDYSKVEVLQRQENSRIEKIIARWQSGVFTWDEMREKIGEEQFKVLAARVVFLPSGVAMAKDPADQAGIMSLPVIGAPAPGDALSQVARAGALMGSREGQRQANNVLAARALQLARKDVLETEVVEGDAVPFAGKNDFIDVEVVHPEHPYLQERLITEAKFEGLLLALSNRQGDVACDRLMHAKVLKGTRHWVDKDGAETKATKPLDPFYAVERQRWAKDATDAFETALRPVLVRESNRVMRDLKANGLDVPSTDVLSSLRGDVLKDVLEIVEQSVMNQSTRIADKVKELDDAGESIDSIKKAIRKQIGTQSSWHKGLSNLVTGSAIEGIKDAVYATVPGVMKTWNTEEDERVRDTHFWVNGRTVHASEMFYVGETMMRFPQDPRAPIGEVAGCRCWLEYSL